MEEIKKVMEKFEVEEKQVNLWSQIISVKEKIKGKLGKSTGIIGGKIMANKVD